MEFNYPFYALEHILRQNREVFRFRRHTYLTWQKSVVDCQMDICLSKGNGVLTRMKLPEKPRSSLPSATSRFRVQNINGSLNCEKPRGSSEAHFRIFCSQTRLLSVSLVFQSSVGTGRAAAQSANFQANIFDDRLVFLLKSPNWKILRWDQRPKAKTSDRYNSKQNWGLRLDCGVAFDQWRTLFRLKNAFSHWSQSYRDLPRGESNENEKLFKHLHSVTRCKRYIFISKYVD